MQSDKKDYHILSSFWLKIIGMISMIIDHIGVFYEMNHDKIASYSINIQQSLRIIGRLSFVIFAFLIVEGVIHSKKVHFYLLKLLGLALVMDGSYFIIYHEYIGNPITTLFIGALTIYLLRLNKVYLKFLSLVPITAIILIDLDIIPLKADYSLYGLCTILLFYFAYLLSKVSAKAITKSYGLDEEAFMNSSYYLTLRNALSIVFFVSFSLIIYFLNPIWNGHGLFTDINALQVYAIFACLPIALYNSKRGYNKPWFKYSCYAFYPIHILLIYLVFTFLI